MSLIERVVFDWNGTMLADTLASLDADNHVLRHFGGTPVDLKTYQETITMPFVDFYAMHGCNPDELQKKEKELGDVFHEFYEKRASHCRTRKGTREVLKFLQYRHIDAVILSNHTLSGINTQLQRLKISRNYFVDILAHDERGATLTQKNKLQRLEHYLAAHRRKHGHRRTMIVGDSPEEVRTGRALGLITAAMAGGYYATHRLEECNPDFLIHCPKDLKYIIR